MALTAAEQAELAALEQEVGGSSNLSPAEQMELQALEQEFGGAVPSQPVQDVIENEMPEGLQGRFVYKNFTGNPEAGFNYLQKQNPDFELKKDSSGEVIARKRGAQAYGRLDPKGFDWRDLTDVMYDVPAGIGQGIASTGAAVAAGLGTGGTLALPAAAATSALTGAGFEGLRQAIGAGLMQDANNMSTADTTMAGGVGAISPFIFGAGIGTKQATDAVLKSGAKMTAQDLINSGRGFVGRGYDTFTNFVGPKLGAMASGENVQVIKKAKTMLDEISKADKDPNIRTAPLENLVEELPKKLRKVTQETGKRMADIRDMIDNQPGLVSANAEGVFKAPGTIDVQSFYQPFQDLAERMSKSGSATEAQLADAEALKKVIESEFKGLNRYQTAAQVEELKRRFKEKAEKFGMNYGQSGTVNGALGKASAIDGEIAKAFEQSRKNMTASLIERLEQINPNLSKEYKDLNKQYNYLKDVSEENASKIKDAKTAAATLGRGITDDIETKNIQELQKITDIDFMDLAARDQAIKTYSRPNNSLRSLMGTTSTSKTIPLAILGGAAGYGASQASGGESFYLPTAIGAFLGSRAGSPAALRAYMQSNQALRQIPQNLPGYKALPYMMMNMNNNDQGEK